MRRLLLTPGLSRGLWASLALVAFVLGATIASATTLSYPVTAPDGTVVGHVTVTDGSGITGGFTSTYGGPPPSQKAAAEKCGEDHFNWLQIITADSDPPTLPDGTKPTPPYIDPPSGGYGYGWADKLPWYWDEGPDPEPRPANWEDGYHVNDNLVDTDGDTVIDTLRFIDYPSGPAGTHVAFETYLVSLNADGSLHSIHGGFAWTYNNPGEESAAPFDEAGRNIFGPTPGIKMLHMQLPGGAGYRWAPLLGLTPGDANFDGLVDVVDATIVAKHWGRTDPSLTMITWREGDFNLDGMVGAADASIMAANWTAAPVPPGEGVAVPEPSVLALLVCAGVLLAARRRR